MDVKHEAQALKANAQGREAFLAKKRRLENPYHEEGKEREQTAWFLGYDRAKYDHDVANKIEKPPQEFVFPETCFAPNRKVMI